MPTNRSRGFHFERVATRLLSEQLSKRSTGNQYTVIRIPLSAGLFVFYQGQVTHYHGDIVVFHNKGWFVTVEVKSRKRKYSLSNTLHEVKCNYCMIHERRKWFFYIRKEVVSDKQTDSPLFDKETGTLWVQVTQNEFLDSIAHETCSKHHISPIIFLPLPQHCSNLQNSTGEETNDMGDGNNKQTE